MTRIGFLWEGRDFTQSPTSEASFSKARCNLKSLKPGLVLEMVTYVLLRGSCNEKDTTWK